MVAAKMAMTIPVVALLGTMEDPAAATATSEEESEAS
jgi:hypothetical protein